MKSEKIELNVDFIGSQDGLTLTEEKAISDFFVVFNQLCFRNKRHIAFMSALK